MPMRHVDPDAGWPAEDIELLVCPGCRCGLAGSVLWALRQVPRSGELSPRRQPKRRVAHCAGSIAAPIETSKALSSIVINSLRHGHLIDRAAELVERRAGTKGNAGQQGTLPGRTKKAPRLVAQGANFHPG